MMNRVRRALPVVAALAVLLPAGCGGDEGVTSYRAPKSTEAGREARPGPAAQTPAGGEVRFLGAQIPVPSSPGNSYFVRLLGPADRVTAVEKEFDAFLGSIRVPGADGKPISWTAPPSGKEAPARQMRTVTYTLDAPGGPLELYVSDPFGGELLDNVNRWRTDFVGLDKVTKEQLPAVVTEVPLGGTKAYKVDFRGPGGKGGGRPPFMKGG